MNSNLDEQQRNSERIFDGSAILRIIRPMAFNQGFYNLFLALGAGTGLAMFSVNSTIAFTLMFFAASCMIGAGLVLFFSVKTSRPAAIIQAGPPLFGVLFVLLGLALA